MYSFGRSTQSWRPRGGGRPFPVAGISAWITVPPQSVFLAQRVESTILDSLPLPCNAVYQLLLHKQSKSVCLPHTSTGHRQVRVYPCAQQSPRGGSTCQYRMVRLRRFIELYTTELLTPLAYMLQWPDHDEDDREILQTEGLSDHRVLGTLLYVYLCCTFPCGM